MSTMYSNFTEEIMEVNDGPDVSVVSMDFELDKKVDRGLYGYITEAR